MPTFTATLTNPPIWLPYLLLAAVLIVAALLWLVMPDERGDD